MLNENIRFFKPNDPYYYEVDNLPLVQLLENCVDLQNQIDVLPTTEIYVVDAWLSDAFVQKSTFDTRVLEDVEGVFLNSPPFEGTLKKSSIGWGSFSPETQNLSTAFSDVDLEDATAEQVLAFDGDKWVASSITPSIAKLEELEDVTPPTGDNQLLIAGDGTNFKPFKWLETSSITNLEHTSPAYLPTQTNPFVSNKYLDANFPTSYVSTGEVFTLTQDLANLMSIDAAMLTGARDIVQTTCSPSLNTSQGTYQASNGLIIKWANTTPAVYPTFEYTLTWDTPFPNLCMSVIIGCAYPAPHAHNQQAQVVLLDYNKATVNMHTQRYSDYSGHSGTPSGAVIAFGY